MDDCQNTYVRIYAIRAIGSAGSDKDKDKRTLNKNVIEIISLAQEYRDYNEHHSCQDNLRKMVPIWSELNRKLFWFDVDIERKKLNQKGDERLVEWSQAMRCSMFWRFSSLEDFSEILFE